MKITDEEFKEFLECFDPKDIPPDPGEAREAIEKFVDLMELLMRPLPLPPEGGVNIQEGPPIK